VPTRSVAAASNPVPPFILQQERQQERQHSQRQQLHHLHQTPRRRLRRHLSQDDRSPNQPLAVSHRHFGYTESESESDRLLSSNENILIPPSPLRVESLPNDSSASSHSYASEADYEDDDDEDHATAIDSRVNSSRFTPQQNAFSHPPLHRQTSSSTPAHANQLPRPTSRHSSAYQHPHSPLSALAPTNRVDHDAALRASLSTLLSYAAATRNAPKSLDPTVQPARSTRIQPSSIGLVPESVALGVDESQVSKPKISSAVRTNSKDRCLSRRARVAGVEDVPPTLLTWVVGAGVLVLVSAISFSAGYAVGRDVGHAESAAGADVAALGRRQVLTSKGMGLRRVVGAG